MSNYLKISRFFLFLAPFAVALVTPQTLFPFIVGKYSFFRACVDLSLIFLMLAWGSGQFEINKEKLKRLISIGVFVWVFVFLLASFFAYDPWAAFWGNFERGESGVQLLHLLIFFFLLSVLLKNKEDWGRYLKTVLAASIFVIVYGILAGRVPGFVGPEFSLHTRFQGSLGNPDYIGQYMFFVVFFSLYLLLNAISKSQKILYSFLALIFFTAFIWSQTRGAFLGFIAGIFFVLVFLAVFWPQKKGKTLFIVLLSLYLIGIGLFIEFRHNDFVRSLPLIGRFADISLESGKTRIWAWQIAFEGIKERPLLGWGPENFSVVFDKYFLPYYFDPFQGGESWFDRAHSVIFDYGAETGILGLAAYLGIWAFYYVQFFKFLRQKKETFDLLENEKHIIKTSGKRHWLTKEEAITFSLFFAMPFIYIVTGATLFDVLPIYIMLFVFLAFSNYYFEVKKSVDVMKKNYEKS